MHHHAILTNLLHVKILIRSYSCGRKLIINHIYSSGIRQSRTAKTMASTGNNFEMPNQQVPKRESSSSVIAPVLMNLEEFPSSSFSEWIDQIDVVMFDCDGVLWLGNKMMRNAQDLIIKLRAVGKKVFFITNNSTKTRDEFLAKFNAFGFQVTMDEVVSSSYLVALYLLEKKFDKKAYVIGTTGITKELNSVGIPTLPLGPDAMKSKDILELVKADHKFDAGVGAVVVGYDCLFNYEKLFVAATYLNNPECLFIATNTDERFPSADDKMVIPGTGSIVSAVQTAAEREPVVMGKPSTEAFNLIDKTVGLNPRRTLMIGDRANTDILFGTECNMWTLLVLSGVTTIQEVRGWKQRGINTGLVPNFYLNEVSDLYNLISKKYSL